MIDSTTAVGGRSTADLLKIQEQVNAEISARRAKQVERAAWMQQLYDVMCEHGVTVEDLQDALTLGLIRAQKGHVPEAAAGAVAAATPAARVKRAYNRKPKSDAAAATGEPQASGEAKPKRAYTKRAGSATASEAPRQKRAYTRRQKPVEAGAQTPPQERQPEAGAPASSTPPNANLSQDSSPFVPDPFAHSSAQPPADLGGDQGSRDVAPQQSPQPIQAQASITSLFDDAGGKEPNPLPPAPQELV